MMMNTESSSEEYVTVIAVCDACFQYRVPVADVKNFLTLLDHMAYEVVNVFGGKSLLSPYGKQELYMRRPLDIIWEAGPPEYIYEQLGLTQFSGSTAREYFVRLAKEWLAVVSAASSLGGEAFWDNQIRQYDSFLQSLAAAAGTTAGDLP